SPAARGQRPFALTLQRGNLFVGYTDTGEAQPFSSAASQDLHSYVASVELDQLSDTAWQVVQSTDLGCHKGTPAAGVQPASVSPHVERWNTWTDEWGPIQPGGWGQPSRDQAFNAGQAVGGVDAAWGNGHIYPQPLLSSLTFD